MGNEHSNRNLWLLAIALFVVTSGLGIGAYLYFERVRENLRQESADAITSIADLKISQIAKWKDERLADAEFFFANRAFFRFAKEVSERRQGNIEEFNDWLLPLLSSHDYRLIVLVDASRKELFRVGEPDEAIGPEAWASMDQAALARRVRFSDLYLSPAGVPSLDVTVPLLEKRGTGSHPAGFLLFRIDPDKQLFPLLRSWPRGSATGETLLLRREGDSIVFLSWLRHREDAPLSVKIPLTRTDLPAVFAALGGVGIVEGRDYRGVRVLAAVRGVPSSSWFLVSKVDLDEVYGGVGERTQSFILETSALVVLAFLGVGLFFRQQHLQWSLQQARLQSEREALTKHFGQAARHANDAILLADSSGRIVEVNDRAVELYGRSRAELLDLTMEDLLSPSATALDPERVSEMERDGVIYESVHRGQDGSDISVEVSARRIEVNGRRGFLQAIVRDVTDRKDAEKRIAHLNRLYSLQSQIGQAIIRSEDQQSLFEEACRIAVEEGLFRLAWVGVKDELTGAVTPVAKAGHDDGYVDRLSVTANDEVRGRGPAGTAMREKRCVVCNDILVDERMRPWWKDCEKRAFRSIAVFPILVEGVDAILALYSAEVGFFDEEEVGALKTLTADLAFAVKSHQGERDRREAEQALMASERKLRNLVETTHDLVWAMDREGRISEMSSDSVRIFGLQPEELIGRKFTELLHPDSLDEGWEAFQAGVRTGRPTVSFEAKTIGKRSREVVLSINAVFIHDDNGKFVGEFGTAQDITDRKRAEIALRESQERSREAEAVAHVGSWELDSSTGALFLSDEAQRLFGLRLSSEPRPISELTALVDDSRRVVRALMGVLRRGTKLETTLTIHPADGGDPRVLAVVAERKQSELEAARVVGILRDITPETQAAEALRRTEEKLHALFESDAVGVLFGDIHGRILDANQKLLDILGYSREELERDQIGWLQLTPPEFLPLDDRGIREAREHGSCAPYQKQYIRKDGSRVWVLVGYTLIGERREESAAFVIDLTSLKKAEEASKEAATKYRLLVEQASDGIYAADSDGRITLANSQFCEMVGYSAEEISELHITDLLPAEEVAKQAARENKARAGANVLFECLMQRRDGTVFPVEASLSVVPGGGFQEIVRDITQRRADEERLRLLSSALHSAGNGVVITDRNGVISWVNNAFTDLTGYSSEEVVGGNPRLLKSGHHDDAFYSNLWKTVLSGEIWHGELVNRRKDGSYYQEEMTITPIRGGTGEVTHFVAIKQDCTERKRAQETLRRTNERLVETLKELKEAERQIIQQEQLRALGTMASGIAHDFNNSLLVILGFSELLLNQPETLADSEKAGRYLLFINTAAKDAGKVVARLREFYRKRDKSDIFESVDLNALIEAAVSLTRPRWESQTQVGGHAIEFVRELGDVPAIDGDQSELREALTNLIFNSVDAMPHGGTIKFRTETRHGRVILQISDTGLGMSEQVKSRCLEPFFTTKGDQGSGLGLSMVYGIVKRHDGEVNIETAIGRGTTITLAFPVPEVRLSDDSAAPELRPQTPSKILLIDDEHAVLQVLTHYLEVDGHNVESSASGGEGLEKFKDGDFDLVILDRAMPGMNGDQVAKEIREMAPATPIIMLTGFGSMMADVGEKPGAVDLVLGKPVTQRQVRTAIAQVIGN